MFQSRRRRPFGPDGWRAYVVGDVHGRLDLLDRMLDRIVADHAARRHARGLIVLLGDLIDRGPASAQVVDRVRTLDLPGFRIVTLAGNHEEVLLRILDGQADQIAGWLRFGGAETLQSYGANPSEIGAMPPNQGRQLILELIPKVHRNYLDSLVDSFRFGDFLCVHAGIRPGIPLDRQSASDLRWIREPFLSDPRDHGFVVVHGHTITETVERRANRIGIDTGAYASGRLSAVCIDGEALRFLTTDPAGGVDETEPPSA